MGPLRVQLLFLLAIYVVPLHTKPTCIPVFEYYDDVMNMCLACDYLCHRGPEAEYSCGKLCNEYRRLHVNNRTIPKPQVMMLMLDTLKPSPTIKEPSIEKDPDDAVPKWAVIFVTALTIVLGVSVIVFVLAIIYRSLKRRVWDKPRKKNIAQQRDRENEYGNNSYGPHCQPSNYEDVTTPLQESIAVAVIEPSREENNPIWHPAENSHTESSLVLAESNRSETNMRYLFDQGSRPSSFLRSMSQSLYSDQLDDSSLDIELDGFPVRDGSIMDFDEHVYPLNMSTRTSTTGSAAVAENTNSCTDVKLPEVAAAICPPNREEDDQHSIQCPDLNTTGLRGNVSRGSPDLGNEASGQFIVDDSAKNADSLIDPDEPISSVPPLQTTFPPRASRQISRDSGMGGSSSHSVDERRSFLDKPNNHVNEETIGNTADDTGGCTSPCVEGSTI